MRSTPPELLPLFRSAGQGRLLARLFLEPERPAPMSELARELNLDPGGISREANRLERAGLVHSERIGNQRRLIPNLNSPFYNELRGLLLKAYGPAFLLGAWLSDLKG